MITPDTKLRHRHEDVLPQVSSPRTTQSMSSTDDMSVSTQTLIPQLPYNQQHQHHNGTRIPSAASSAYPESRGHQWVQQYTGILTLAGMCTSLLSTVFGLFHVDVFLRVYQLPWHSYSMGTMIFAAINTANDVLGAWLLDKAATKRSRSDLIGISGVIFSLFFLAPFFRWKDPSPNGYYDEAHFVISICMYDTMYSFTTILLGSLVTDNHTLTDKERVSVLASGKVLSLVTTFAVSKIGLVIFDQDDMKKFRLFLVCLSAIVTVIFLLAQTMAHYHIFIRWESMRIIFLDVKHEKPPIHKSSEKLIPRQVVLDFWKHDNFWAWIWMELLLEAQNSFYSAFLKTFVDQLLHDEGVSRETCDWLLSSSRPLGLILAILCYIPIRRIGYTKVYNILIAISFAMSLLMLMTSTHQSTTFIAVFLVIYPATTAAVVSTGFHLVMSDMVLEMKRIHAMEGRFDEPSLAALFIGVNALFCKPAESILPIVSAHMLENYSLATEDDENVQKVLFKLLVIPPLVFSIVEFLSWRRYTLTPSMTTQMRDNLRLLELNHITPTNGMDSVLPIHTKMSDEDMSLS
ncbi:hypothetical protein IV203_013911 [Nitzschia inconspicua]|uniref:Uncharacterized protein n=1 Tax=Nitzschia inconspicua TaxID=303405 RepID=A0A9K3Q8F3_9STRA|nr:hypothetical protein IV203_013911 [Nitzschia inconspicua]